MSLQQLGVVGRKTLHMMKDGRLIPKISRRWTTDPMQVGGGKIRPLPFQ